MSEVDKHALKAELLDQLRADLETLERAHRAAREGATHEEAKPENDKDTRALEQSYLARGQAARIDELRSDVAAVSALPVREPGEASAALGSLVTVEEDGAVSLLFLAPAGGGARLAGGSVQVVTPRSPVGQAFLGKVEGDEVSVVLAGRTRAMQIVRVS
jgi:transcription elongation GreA/GreB family factor